MELNIPQPPASGRNAAFSHFVARLFAVLALILMAATGFGQNVAQISGVVHDPTGAVLSNAEVKVTQTDTGIVHATATDSAGTYVIPQLPSGPYQVEVTSPGFKSYKQT